MSGSSECDDDGAANIGVGAPLLQDDGGGKNKNAWKWAVCRISLYITVCNSLKKPTTTAAYESEQPPAATTSSSNSNNYVAIDVEDEGAEQRIRDDIGRIVREQDSESLHQLGGVHRVCNVLANQRQPSEAGNLGNGNHAVLCTSVPVHGTSFLSSLSGTCKRNSYPILMLLISAGLCFATEFKQEGPRYGWHDGAAIVFAVILLVAFSSIASFWRERNMMKLSKKSEFVVERGEDCAVVAISDIVMGDKVYLCQGDRVPADGLFLDSDTDNFVLAEAIKGKSDPETNPFLIAGSMVIEGRGWMLVTSVGTKTNLVEKRGLLESRIEKPISYIDKIALFVSALVALVVLIRLVCKKDGDSNGLPEIKGKVSVGTLIEVLERIFLRPQGRVSILSGLVTVAILCMQHGMSLMVTISLKYQLDKIVSKQDAVLNDLSACTTMGLVTVICIDASGGLLPLEVSRIWMGEGDISKVEGSQTDLVLPEVLQQGVGLLSVLSRELSLSPISNSLISWAETTCGMNINSFAEKFNILQHSKLNSGKECAGVLVRKVGDNEQVLHLHWSGAASTILEMCSQYYDSKGECHVMENQKAKFGQVIKEMEDSGLKTIAFAYRQPQVEELEQDGLILLGLIGLKHTCRESAKLALEYLRNAGIEIKLVSEDDIVEARAIACELGLEVSVDGTELEGKELQDLNGSARIDKVDLALVMGGFRPEDKLLMVQCLQEKGRVVAFIGRLTTSHASVLKLADVGIVHNSLRLSTIVDSESSGICIKCFSALEPIVRAGRSTYNNIQKFIQLQLTLSISGLLITLITTMSTGESPLTAIQLFWVNMLMSLLGGLMMVMELNSQEQLANQPSPSDRNQSIVTKEILKSIVIQVLYQASVSMILEFWGHVTEIQKQTRKTMIFNTFLLCQVFNQLNSMHLLKKEVFKIVLKSYCFLVALGACFLMQVLVVEYAKCLANCMCQNATQWSICVLVGALSWVFERALKILPVFPSTNCYDLTNQLESTASPLDSPADSVGSISLGHLISFWCSFSSLYNIIFH